jgi:hypothetical protein
VHQQPAEQCIDACEDAAARLLEDVDEAVHVARIGNQPVLGADRVVGDEIHHQGEHVVERQRRDHDVLTGAQRVSNEGLKLLGIGDEVAVGQRGALRKPRGSAGVLQEEQIVAAQRHWRESQIRAFSKRVGKSDDVLEPGVHCGAREGNADSVGQADADDALDPGCAGDLSESRGHSAENDNDFGTGVVQLVLELTRRVERVYVHLHRTGADDPQHRERESRDVRQHHGNTFALLYAELALKIGREAAR